MTTVGVLVEQVRSTLMGSLTDEISILGEDYVAGSGQVVLKYAKKNIGPGGGLVCVGLNTFYVLAVNAAGDTLTVHPGADGGPEVNVTAGEVVRFKPTYTTWSIFREWCNELSSMSSPNNGLYAFGSFESSPNWQSGTYALPDAWATAGEFPLRLLIARYKQRGHTSWQAISGEWQADGNEVRIYGEQPNASSIEFVLAFPFKQPVDLTTDPADCGLNENNWDIPGLGAMETLSRGGESRRMNPSSQGDPRRAAEIPTGANIGISREWGRKQAERMQEELTRLQAQFGYQQLPVARQTHPYLGGVG